MDTERATRQELDRAHATTNPDLKDKTMTPTERAKAHRDKRRATGWKMLHVQLPPDAAKCLADKMVSYQMTASDVVAEAIRNF